MLYKELHISNLIFAELSETISDAEKEELQDWINASAENSDFYHRLTNEHHFQTEMKAFRSTDTDHIWDLTQSALAAQETIPTNTDIKRIPMWPKWLGIAVAVIGIAIGTYFYTSRHLNDRRDLLTSANDITPGKNTATLSFNGRSMQLSDAKTGVKFDEDKLTYNDGSPLSPQRGALPEGEHSMVTATTPRGGTYEFVLQDGTRVWLNADSKLEFYPSYKNKSQRIVKLEGEGYFEVAKDKAHPFIVESAGQKVEVLGTHFNINAYKDEGGIKTTLLEGRVNVNGTILQPKQQSVIQPGGKVAVVLADPNATAWKEGLFSFNDADIQTVMRQMSRWYNVDIEYEGNIPKKVLTGKMYRNVNASQVLKLLDFYKIGYKMTKNKIIISN